MRHAKSKGKPILKPSALPLPDEEEESSCRLMETPTAAHLGVTGAIFRSLVRELMPAGASSRPSAGSLIENVLAGLPFSELILLQEMLDLPLEQLAETLGISRATLHRRKHSGRLEQGESDRVVRYARLMGKAADVFGGMEEGRQWLQVPQFGLGNAVPLDYARTEIGAREVENLLGRIEYGVYS